jgi:hypothetical protein
MMVLPLVKPPKGFGVIRDRVVAVAAAALIPSSFSSISPSTFSFLTSPFFTFFLFYRISFLYEISS